MPRISYAQNFEDVMLWRALQDVTSGFYIDIGANDPDVESVTRLFYDSGWTGINVEPVQAHYEDLQRKRPSDINVRAAIGDKAGSIEIWEPSVRGWATASADVIAQHQKQGYEGKRKTVPLMTLAELCEQHVTGEIHFLKIDVEGFEKPVLQGMDFSRFRPWVLVIEATEPNSKTENYTEWEDLVTASGYRLVYEDGLNRFYLADEHAALAPTFRYPPNVFDEFEFSEVVRFREALDQAEARAAAAEADARKNIQAAEARADAAETNAHAAEVKADAAEARAVSAETRATSAEARAQSVQESLENQLAVEKGLRAAIENSTSWRLTAPLRHSVTAVRTLRSETLPRHIREVLQWGVRYLNRHPRLKAGALGLLSRVPALRQRLFNIMMASSSEQWQGPAQPAEGPAMHPRVLPVFPRMPETMLLPSPDGASLRWVRITGHLEGHYSLAIVNRGIAGALEKSTAGRLQFVPYHGEPYKASPDLPEQQERLLGASLRRDIPADASAQTLSVVHHFPFIIDELPAWLKGMLFFWEETAVPTHIIEHINEHMNLVWVAADAVKRALLNSGCRVPVFVLPLGIDHLISSDTQPVDNLMPEEGQPVRFLHLSSAFDRKGVDVLLEAWMEAFTATDEVELYIKTFPNPHNRIREQLEEIRTRYDTPPRVEIDEAPLDDDRLLELYRTAQVMVLPTRGEGFNLPAAEAIAMGLPVITTGSSAQVDFCTTDTATLLDFQFAPTRSHLASSGSCWLEPDRKTLTRALRETRQQILAGDPRLKARRRLAMDHVRSTYCWDNSARALLASAEWLENSAGSAAKLEKIALVSPWDTPCGIAEYSHNLFSAIGAKPGPDVEVYCDDRTRQSTDRASVTWSLGAEDSMQATLREIGASGAQAVVVQHQPSLFPLTDDVCQTLAQLAGQGRVVILELHATAPLLAESRLSPVAVEWLTNLDRILVHTPGDLNRLLSLGLADNVMLFEHGVIQPLERSEGLQETSLDIPADALVLGSFGFALPHKGLDTLIDTIRPLEQATGRSVHLVAVNSVLDERSSQVLQQCRTLARQAGVEDRVHWVSDYQPIKTCQNLLGAADYIVFPYRQTRESASGAVTIGLSTLRPVLVSPLDIFSDLADVTVRMDGDTSDDIIRAVLDLEDQPGTRHQLVERQNDWLRARDWRVISARLETLLGSLLRERQLGEALASARREHQDKWRQRRRRQLLVDVSELYYRNARTGIQRVVCNLLDEFWRNPPAGYDIRPVYSADGEDFLYTSRFNPQGVHHPEDEQPVRVAPGDLFFGLDLSAHLFPQVERRLEAYRMSGVRVIYMVYDILPLTTKGFFDEGIVGAFDQWVRGLGRQADGVVCISSATACELEQWLLAEGGLTPGQLPHISASHLGADFRPSHDPESLSDEDQSLLERLAGETTFLMVGTIEPRKGHDEVLEAFDQLWKAQQPCNLVLVGKQGWMVERLVRRLREHPQLDNRLFWLTGVSDEFLERLYDASTCLIAASHAEGFGLPLIEAAQRRLPVIARDIPVFREVAGEHAFYFEGGNGTSLARAIEHWMSLYDSGQHPRVDDMPWLSWAQSAQRMLDTIVPERAAR